MCVGHEKGGQLSSCMPHIGAVLKTILQVQHIGICKLHMRRMRHDHAVRKDYFSGLERVGEPA